MTSGAAINAMVAPWFDRRRPTALGMAFKGASISGVVFSPLWVALIGALDMAHAASLVAAILLAAVWLLAGHYLATGPAAKGRRPDGGGPTQHLPAPHWEVAPPGRAWRDRRAATLIAGTTLGLFAQIGLVSQLFASLAPRLGEAAAGSVIGLAPACAIVGRTALVHVLPPGPGRRTGGAANLALQAVGSVVLLSGADASVGGLRAVRAGAGQHDVVATEFAYAPSPRTRFRWRASTHGPPPPSASVQP